MSSNSSEKAGEVRFEDRLSTMYDRYRRQHLEDELDELAATMEASLLQQELAESFFDESIDIDEDIKAAVESTVEKLEDEQYDTVEAELDDLASQIQHAETQIANRIQQLRIERQDTATAMRRLNERVERTDRAQLEALESLLQDWNWKAEIYDDSHESFEARRTAAAEYGDNMKFIFESLKDELFGVYEDTELRPLVDKLLDDDRLDLGGLSTEERRQLAESDLADYIELKLS